MQIGEKVDSFLWKKIYFDEYGTEIFEKAGESWGIDLLKRALLNTNTVFFVAFYKGILRDDN